MHKLFGMLDSLEAIILEGKKIPFSDKVVVNEQQVLQLLDKFRLVLKSEDKMRESGMDMSSGTELLSSDAQVSELMESSQESVDAIREGALRLRQDAEDYADNVLANLQLMLTKLQKNFITLEKSVESGRLVLNKEKQQERDNSEIR